jgi:zinc transporter 1/2/3
MFLIFFVLFLIFLFHFIGCLNSLAAGIMIYVALVEMIAEDFQHASVPSNSPLKIKMFSAVTAGAAIMAFLAIWA